MQLISNILLAQSTNISFPLFTGIMAAMIHVLMGPDHLAAVAPLTVEKKTKTWKIGLFWGFGHLTGMLLIGILFTLFRDFIPVERISSHSEQLVGIVLISIGIWSFYQVKRSHNKVHRHPHTHHGEENFVHIHKHQHHEGNNHTHKHEEEIPSKGNWAAYSVGTLHGLAGVSHFLLFLPTLAFESSFDSILYLIGFAIGTVLAMTLFSAILGQIAKKASLNHKNKIFTGIRIGAGAFALIIGIYWVLSTI